MSPLVPLPWTAHVGVLENCYDRSHRARWKSYDASNAASVRVLADSGQREPLIWLMVGPSSLVPAEEPLRRFPARTQESTKHRSPRMSSASSAWKKVVADPPTETGDKPVTRGAMKHRGSGCGHLMQAQARFRKMAAVASKPDTAGFSSMKVVT
ncbi:hypothetical protein D9M68_168960 [compost metagenome]